MANDFRGDNWGALLPRPLPPGPFSRLAQVVDQTADIRRRIDPLATLPAEFETLKQRTAAVETDLDAVRATAQSAAADAAQALCKARDADIAAADAAAKAAQASDDAGRAGKAVIALADAIDALREEVRNAHAGHERQWRELTGRVERLEGGGGLKAPPRSRPRSP